MVQHLTQSETRDRTQLCNSMHEDRKRVFVDTLGWDIPHDGVFEIDRYDNDAAEYLILQDSRTHRHLGSVRLLRTTGPHMLADVFPFLCEGDVPRGPHIGEITRLIVSPSVPYRERQAVRNQVARATIEYALMTGIEKFTAVCEMSMLSQILASGWRVDPLGLPQCVDGSMIGALILHVEANSISKTRDTWRHPGPALRIIERAQALAA
jgi:N-acyl-L-homoserine lactone synthetase